MSRNYLQLQLQEMAVNISRVYQGFISKGPFVDGGPEAYFADVSEPTFVIKSCLYNVQTLILDAVVVGCSSPVLKSLTLTFICRYTERMWFGKTF